jgi:hypothetical protein
MAWVRYRLVAALAAAVAVIVTYIVVVLIPLAELTTGVVNSLWVIRPGPLQATNI